MGRIGHEIVQSRVWVDPNNPPPPNLNYKLTYPITVFDAVRKDMIDEDSETLTQVLERINQLINNKQDIIPAKPANYLVTYGGIAGEVGSIQITNHIPWDPTNQSNDRIPTEKAVGDMLRGFGFDPDNPTDFKVRWDQIYGRPNIYDCLGEHDDGVVTQCAVTEAINSLKVNVDGACDDLCIIGDMIKDHIENVDNPHNVTIDQIGAASSDLFNQHIESDNPHNITASTIGLENVDNTSDMDKPISTATQQALDHINNILNNMSNGVGDLNFIISVEYDNKTSSIILTYRDGSTISIAIPTEESINNIKYNSNNKEFILYKNNGHEEILDVSELYIRYIGSTEGTITIAIDGNQDTGNQIIRAFINPNSITSEEIADNAIINRHIKNQSVGTNKIEDLSITTIKYANGSIIGSKIADKTIINSKLADRSIDGRTLFTSDIGNRILAVIDENENPQWVQINSEMIASKTIESINIADKSIINDLIADDAIDTSNIKNASVTSEKLAPDAISTNNIADGSITEDKLAENSINNKHIQDGTIDPSKLNSTNEEYKVIGVTSSDSTPMWTRILNKMIDDRAVDGRTLFTSPVPDVILAVHKENSNPYWTKLVGRMISDHTITSTNIGFGEVTTDNIAHGAVNSDQIAIEAIKKHHIGVNEINPASIETSDIADRVLAVIDNPNSDPKWTQVTGKMIADRSITGENLFRSDNPYHILGVTEVDEPPKYVQITSEFIVDETITPEKLLQNIALIGTPELTIQPEVEADNNQLANTAWVRQTIFNIMEGKFLDGNKVLADHSIDGKKLFTSDTPGVLGINSPNEDVHFILVNENLIEDEAVTESKIKRNIQLPGKPTIEVRPDPTSSDEHGNGNLIPDCQWVLDRIKELGGGGGPLVLTAVVDEIEPELIDPLVDGTLVPEELDPLNINNQVLDDIETQRIIDIVNENITPEASGTIEVDPSTNIMPIDLDRIASILDETTTPSESLPDLPIYSRGSGGIGGGGSSDEPYITEKDIVDRNITGKKLFSSDIPNRLLGVLEAGSDPVYLQANTEMIEDQAITSEKLNDNLTLPKETTVKNSNNYETRSVRNITISPKRPTGGRNGDMWFRFI